MENPRVIVPTMEGITTVIAAFLIFCFIKPEIVKNRTQFIAAFLGLVVIVLLYMLRLMFSGSSALQVVTAVFTGLIQIGDLILIVLFTGGLTLRQFGTDVGRAYEVIRRGEEEKEIIIPLTGQQPLPRDEPRQ